MSISQIKFVSVPVQLGLPEELHNQLLALTIKVNDFSSVGWIGESESPPLFLKLPNQPLPRLSFNAYGVFVSYQSLVEAGRESGGGEFFAWLENQRNLGKFPDYVLVEFDLCEYVIVERAS